MATHVELPRSSARRGDRSIRSLLVVLAVVALGADLGSLLGIIFGWEHGWIPLAIGIPAVSLLVLAYAGAVDEAMEERTFHYAMTQVIPVMRPAREVLPGMWLYHPSGGFVRIIDVTHGRRVILSTALDTTIVEPDEHVGLADFRRLGGRVHPDMAPVQTGSDVWCPCVPQELDHNEFAKPR